MAGVLREIEQPTERKKHAARTRACWQSVAAASSAADASPATVQVAETDPFSGHRRPGQLSPAFEACRLTHPTPSAKRKRVKDLPASLRAWCVFGPGRVQNISLADLGKSHKRHVESWPWIVPRFAPNGCSAMSGQDVRAADFAPFSSSLLHTPNPDEPEPCRISKKFVRFQTSVLALKLRGKSTCPKKFLPFCAGFDG